MKNNAILFARIDREDLHVNGGIVFNVQDTSTYEAAYNEIKVKLENPAFINYIIEEHCLLDDLFDEDDSYTFIKTYYKYSVFFVFKNDDGDEVEYEMSTNFVHTIQTDNNERLVSESTDTNMEQVKNAEVSSEHTAEVVANKQLRKDIDEIIERVKELPTSRERSLTITKLQEGVMWLGMDLKRLNEPDPYPNSKKPETVAQIESTADGLKM